MNTGSNASGARAPKVLILADDLSGAADCGVACAETGLETVVALRPDRAPPAEAMAIDADTRQMNVEAAVEVTGRLVASHAPSEACLVFKKLDSTLRGHIGPELNAVLRVVRAMRRDTVIALAPAFPALGRTTVNGCQRLNGIPLEESDIWRTERGRKTASLPDMMWASGLRPGPLSLDRIRGNIRDLAVAMQDLADVSDVLVCDAETDADLAAVADASLRLRSNVIWAGAAGLARQVVQAAGLAKPRSASAAPVCEGSIVFVVGSRSGVSRRQAAALAALEGVVSIVNDPTATLQELRMSGAAQRLGAALADGADVIIWQSEALLESGTDDVRRCGGVSELLASESHRIGALFATGGDTARCLLDALDVEALEILREIEPGIPLSVAIGPRRFPVITKAGAFGTDTTMQKCRALLRSETNFRPAPASGPEGLRV